MSQGPLELCCGICGDSFVLAKGEASCYRDRGLERPKRCGPCRETGPAEDSQRQAPAHEEDPSALPCDACGALTALPFAPKTDRPIYCERCFSYR